MLHWLYRFSNRRGIPHLMKYVVIISAVVYLLPLIGIDLTPLLYLDPALVLKGQIWRLFTFVFLFPAGNLFFAVFAFYFYYLIGETLEQQWGDFVFTVYYVLGVLFSILVSFITHSPIVSTLHINLSLFLAFGYLYPDFSVLLFMIIPVKIKYIAGVYGILILLDVIRQPLSGKLLALTGVFSFLLFFGKEWLTRRQTHHSFQKKKKAKKVRHLVEVRHRCEVCNRTELDDPHLEFRFCSRCNGYHEYCTDHIANHEHKTQ